MNDKRNLLARFSSVSVDPDSLPFYPIVELVGDCRVLVENHCGVIYYSEERIGIRVKYGELQICGYGLKLQHMTKVKLIITGRIDSVCIAGRGNR